MKEFAFDIKLAAVVRVCATDEKSARAILPVVLDCIDLSEATIDGINDGYGVADVKLTEASISQDDEDGPQLFEVDGKPV